MTKLYVFHTFPLVLIDYKKKYSPKLGDYVITLNDLTQESNLYYVAKNDSTEPTFYAQSHPPRLVLLGRASRSDLEPLNDGAFLNVLSSARSSIDNTQSPSVWVEKPPLLLSQENIDDLEAVYMSEKQILTHRALQQQQQREWHVESPRAVREMRTPSPDKSMRFNLMLFESSDFNQSNAGGTRRPQAVKKVESLSVLSVSQQVAEADTMGKALGKSI
ncbi:MAG: hypothetical protein P1U61_07075 [Legionellaceae bacterium]|nr:hypothetical protein [Legionellaceae bacterium]